MNHRDVYTKMRTMGMTYQEIADIHRVSRQAVHSKVKYNLLGGGKIQRFLKSLNLKIDQPIFTDEMSKFENEYIYKSATRLNWRVVMKHINRNGIDGTWICRIK